MPAKVLNAGYAAPLRRYVESNVTIVALDDWSDDARRLFDADTFPLGVTVTKMRRDRRIDVTSSSESFTMDRKRLAIGSPGSEWTLIGDEVSAILRRLRDEHPPLATSLGRQPVMGVKSGDNRAFFFDVARVCSAHVVTTDGLRVPLARAALCVRGRDVRRWRAEAKRWLLWPRAEDRERLPRWLEHFATARGLAFDDLQLAYVRPEHAGIKVVWKDLGRGISAAVVEESTLVSGRAVPVVPNQTLYAIDAASLDEAHMLAAILNSTIVNALAVSIAERAKDYHFRYFGRTIARVPLPRITTGAAWTSLARMSRRAHHGKQIDEDELDRIVMSLYGIDEHEHAILSSFLARRLGHV